VLHKRRYFKGRKIFGIDIRDIRWLNTDGNDMSEGEWSTNFIRCMGMLLNGELMTEVDERGEVIKDDILLLIVNSYWEPIYFTLPHEDVSNQWELLVDTSRENIANDYDEVLDVYEIQSRSLVLLRNVKY